MALRIHDTERGLRERVSLFGRAPIPSGRLRVVLGNALAQRIHGAEHGLRSYVALIGRHLASDILYLLR